MKRIGMLTLAVRFSLGCLNLDGGTHPVNNTH